MHPFRHALTAAAVYPRPRATCAPQCHVRAETTDQLQRTVRTRARADLCSVRTLCGTRGQSTKSTDFAQRAHALEPRQLRRSQGLGL